MVDNVVILAGGSGTRLWPASNKARPKQFLEIGGGKSLISRAFERAFALTVKGEVMVVTHRDHVKPLLAEIEKIDDQEKSDWTSKIRIFPEPEGKNTAPAIALAISYLISKGKSDETVLVMTADHLIKPIDTFVRDVEKADFLAREDYLVTFGIQAIRPETGYGYIEAGEEHGPGKLIQAFREKPDRETAERYAVSGRHFWNSGMFCFRASAFAREAAEHAKKVALPFLLDGDGFSKAALSRVFPEREDKNTIITGESSHLEEIYRNLEKISVDYAVMEKSSRCAMVEAGFTWSDVGSWDEVAEMGEGTVPLVLQAESAGNFVHSDLPVALCNVEDLEVVCKNGVILVCKKGSAQLVRDIVEEAKKSGRTELL